MNKCLNCGEEVKNKYCDVICQTIYKFGEFKRFKVKCFKCDKEFEVEEREKLHPQKEKYYCSRSCANSRIRTTESKLKTSESIKKLILNGNPPGFLSKDYKINRFINDKINKICPICNKEFKVVKSLSKKIYCSKKCYLEDKHCEFRNNGKGGKRIGSGKGKSGWYKGYWCDSSWELAYVIYNIDHDVPFVRNYEGFTYTFKNKEYKFYPDFITNDVFVEIKGYLDEKNKSKITQFNNELIILDKRNIKPYIEYVVKKYGNNYIELYENNPYKLKNNKCLICGKDCVNIYCSRKCSGVGVSLLKSSKKEKVKNKISKSLKNYYMRDGVIGNIQDS